MDIIYIVFFGIIGILIAIGFGLQLSHDIEDFIIYFLFWMLYIITIITFINIILVINYYLTMKNKAGPPGKDGALGDRGDKGDTGLCDATCRDSICEDKINAAIIQQLKDKNQGVAFKMNNTYIQSKVAQMCRSKEFENTAPIKGAQNLINYLTEIWKIWIDDIYAEGGLTYFQNIGAENTFDWVKDNPFNEIKKYDVFYWGMGSNFKPQISIDCSSTRDGNNPYGGVADIIFKVSTTTSYNKIGNLYNGADKGVTFWCANTYTDYNNTYYPVGYVAYSYHDVVNLTCKIGTTNCNPKAGPNLQTIIVAGDVKSPLAYDLIWSNEGYGNNLWIWRPIAPVTYVALGDIITYNNTVPSTGTDAPIRCVPKAFAVQKTELASVIWSANNNNNNNPTPASILGYIPNNYIGNTLLVSSESNAYNLFRAVASVSPYIPESDVNGSFYYLYNPNYLFNIEIGSNIIENGEIDALNETGDNSRDIQSPSARLADVKVGKGYVYNAQTDAKYSVISYLKLKNIATLTHKKSRTVSISAQIIPNAISNTYLIQYKQGNVIKCLNFDNSNTAKSLINCDDQNSKQYFSIIFTGNETNECKLKHHDTDKFVVYKDSKFSLDSSANSNIDYQLFMMST